MADLLRGPALDDRAQLVLSVPMQAALGAVLIDPSHPPAGAEFIVGPLAGNGAGGAHAAAISTVLELAAYLALLPELAVDEHAVTHSVSTQLIAPARIGATVRARAQLDRRTRRTAFLNAIATVDGQIVARALLTKTVVEFRPPG